MHHDLVLGPLNIITFDHDGMSRLWHLDARVNFYAWSPKYNYFKNVRLSHLPLRTGLVCKEEVTLSIRISILVGRLISFFYICKPPVTAPEINPGESRSHNTEQ